MMKIELEILEDLRTVGGSTPERLALIGAAHKPSRFSPEQVEDVVTHLCRLGLADVKAEDGAIVYSITELGKETDTLAELDALLVAEALAAEELEKTKQEAIEVQRKAEAAKEAKDGEYSDLKARLTALESEKERGRGL